MWGVPMNFHKKYVLPYLCDADVPRSFFVIYQNILSEAGSETNFLKLFKNSYPIFFGTLTFQYLEITDCYYHFPRRYAHLSGTVVFEWNYTNFSLISEINYEIAKSSFNYRCAFLRKTTTNTTGKLSFK